MVGGQSQLDTWDLKPGHENGGPIKPINTSVSGIQISEQLPRLSKLMDNMAIFRTIVSSVEEHGQGTVLMSTGHTESEPVNYPSIGALVSKELEDTDAKLPAYVSLRSPFDAPPARRANSPGFLGARHAPLSLVPNQGDLAQADGRPDAFDKMLRVPDMVLKKSMNERQVSSRVDLLNELDSEFVAEHPGAPGLSHQSAYARASNLLLTPAGKAFALEEEPAKLRERYGLNLFGQGCLLARRLVERGVPFVEVALGNIRGPGGQGWDMHQNIFGEIPETCGVLDNAWSSLIIDLKDTGLLESTTIICMGEFGRTPRINANKGRDHFSKGWSTVLAGGGIKGGQVIGKTSDDGTMVKDHPVSVGEFQATIYAALGIDPHKEYYTETGRPIRLIEPEVKAVKEALS
jgi:hypothetical protein